MTPWRARQTQQQVSKAGQQAGQQHDLAHRLDQAQGAGAASGALRRRARRLGSAAQLRPRLVVLRHEGCEGSSLRAAPLSIDNP